MDVINGLVYLSIDSFSIRLNYTANSNLPVLLNLVVNPN